MYITTVHLETLQSLLELEVTEEATTIWKQPIITDLFMQDRMDTCPLRKPVWLSLLPKKGGRK
jgi:hypothetical protein